MKGKKLFMNIASYSKKIVSHISYGFLIFFKGTGNKIISLIKAVSKKILSFSFRTILDMVLLLGILFCVVYITYTKRWMENFYLQSIRTDSLVIEKRVMEEQLAKIDSIRLDTVSHGGMIIENTFFISGITEPNRIVSLSINGRIIDASVTQGKKFEFKNIIATPGKNKIVVRSMDETGRSVILEEINFTYGKPSLENLIRDFARGDIHKKQIALTFDGGWLDNAAHEILDDLKEYDIKCTMFVTGNFLKKFPDVVKRMVAEGHEVGNHTWSHPHLTTYEKNRRHETAKTINSRKVKRELEKTARYFKKITGKEISPLWRAPYGEQNEEIRRWAAEAGFRHVGWTVGRTREEGMDTMDWVADSSSNAYYTADEIVDRLLSFGKNSEYEANGAIILMHLGSLRTNDYPHSKLPFIIEEFQKRGYEFMKISEML